MTPGADADQMAYGGQERPPARLVPLLWLAHPATMLAVLVLLVNDHVLKAAWPGLLTGKASDVAGLVVAPALLAVPVGMLLPRVPARPVALACLALTGVGFTLSKATGTGAAVASTVWTAVAGPSLVRADVTDLVALPALLLAGWVFTRVDRRGGQPTTRRPWSQRSVGRPVRRALSRLAARWTHQEDRPAPRDSRRRRMLRRVAVCVALPAATLAVAATSAAPYPEADAVLSWQGRVVVGIDHNYRPADYRTWLIGDGSPDGWRPVTEQDGFPGYRPLDPKHPSAAGSAGPGSASPVRTPSGGTASPVPTAGGGAAPDRLGRATEECVPDLPAVCYRIVPGHLRVEQTADGGRTWAASWELTDEQRHLVARAYDDVHQDADLASRALAVHRTGAGYLVVVANGRDGFAVRDTAGRWTRWAADIDEPFVTPAPQPRPEPDTMGGEIVLALLAGLLALAAGAGMALARSGLRAGPYPLLAGIGALFAILGTGAVAMGHFMLLPGVPTAAVGLVALLAGAVGMLGTVVPTGLRLRAMPLVLLPGPLVAGAGLAPFLAWVAGVLSYSVALPVALAAGVLGIVVAGLVGYGLSRPVPAAERPPRWPPATPPGPGPAPNRPIPPPGRPPSA